MNIDTDFTQSIVIDNIKCLIQDVNMQFGQFNIRFNHGFEVFNVCCGPGGINIDRGPQQTLITETLWLNVIISHS